MKKILSFLMLAAVCANAQTTFTNGVKISALPSVSSISGTETVVLNQSGTTKTATVNQLVGGDVALINTVTNGLAALIATNGAKDTLTTNGLAALIATNGINDVNTSNALQTLISANTARDTATTNGLAAMIAAATAANVATSNSIAGTAAAAAAAAVAPLAANAITNGGNANLANVFYGVTNYGAANGTSYTVNLGAATMQMVTFTNNSDSHLSLANIVAGANVTLIVSNGCANTRYTYNPAGVADVTGRNYFSIGSGKSAILNFVCSGNTTNSVFFSGAAQ